MTPIKPLLPASLRMGTVALTVANLDRSLAYYQQGIGLQLLHRQDQVANLGVDKEVLLQLHEQPGARPTRATTGLYHFALLLPSRLDLARTLHHLIETGVPISGASDHAVSEALYLTDPDGHGIEIYRDRPRHEWVYPDGRLKLVTEPFDLDGVRGELTPDAAPFTGLPAGTSIGHVHLHVADIAASEHFYLEIFGFDLMARYGRTASFIAAGGYHHHLGMNTWAGAGAPPPSPESARLLWYQIILPDTASLEAALSHLQAAHIPITQSEFGYQLPDPSKNTILLSSEISQSS